jgi:hypothetical protein
LLAEKPVNYQITRRNNPEDSSLQGYLSRWKTHVVIHENSLYCCPIFTTIGVFQRTLVKLPNIKFHRNPSSRSRVATCVQTDGRRGANMTKQLELSLVTSVPTSGLDKIAIKELINL